MRIAVCGTKGGSGKSTLAGLLALCFADAGKRVMALEHDRQATMTTWLRSLGGLANPIPDPRIPYPPGISPDDVFPVATMFNIKWNTSYNPTPKERLAETIYIHDFPPASPDALLKMLKEGDDRYDLLLIPCRPAVADIWSIRSFLDELDGYNGKIRIVMNALDNSSISKAGSLDSLLEGIKTPRTKNSLSRRACYSYAMVSGWKALDEKAKSEVLSLALEISR